MKGIILAGGSGTRLHPITKGVSKQLLPVYDKPMIYYPLSVLMLAEVKDILIITTEEDLFYYKKLLGNGLDIGINISYRIQEKPEGLAQAFIIGEDFIGGDSCVLILGDNIFYGQGFTKSLLDAKKLVQDCNKACIFGYEVMDPERYGIAEIDSEGVVLSLEEKPEKPKSNMAVVGLYFYPKGVSKYAKSINRSERGELEITSLNNIYLNNQCLNLIKLGRGLAWLDTGTIDSLAEATEYVKAVQKRHGQIIACLEEIAFKKGFIDKKQLQKLISNSGDTDYYKFLECL